MHPLCFFRTDNIEAIGPFQATSWLDKYLEVEGRVETAGHHELDGIERTLRMLAYRKRPALKERRYAILRQIEAARRKAQDGAFVMAKREAFIGPLTIQMANGHPF